MSIHFIHERGKGPNPLPIILTHGWPDSFYRMHKIIPMLTDPESFGGNAADSFDVIVPSIPGFGFSDPVRKPGWAVKQTAELWASLMRDVLGYQRYAAAGGDWGSPISQLLALNNPTSVIGIHLTDIGFQATMNLDPSSLTPVEQEYLRARQQRFFQEGGYVMIQSTKPQTLAYGLSDSPVGLAAWIIEKFYGWSDVDGALERKYTKDELLTNIMIYWVTQTINSSIRFYYEESHAPSLKTGQRVEVPVAIALFPKDTPAPRALAERTLRIERWTEMPRGGHFPALEEPELLVEDLRAFYRSLR
ncbi:multidrug MFS transporter [Ktedonobacter sp. SOSP1-85]|nr:multidrug MFS transporter [Ktedonobacter sp. SOSP1-85]